jgi:hypothetical protein
MQGAESNSFQELGGILDEGTRYCNFVDFVITGFMTNLFHHRKQNTICTYLLLIANRQS